MKPLYNIPHYYVFLPTTFKMFGPGKVPWDQCIHYLSITFDFPGPKDDFDLSVKFCAESCPVQSKIKSRKREEKQQERIYKLNILYIDQPLGCSAMQSRPRLFT